MEGGAADLPPQLLDHMIALGEIAQQLDHMPGNNGHRNAKTAELLQMPVKAVGEIKKLQMELSTGHGILRET